MTKIPCGGFYLDDMLGVDENGKLGVNGGEPYKQLVTDAEGKAKWDERLAYETEKYYKPPVDVDNLDSVTVGDSKYMKVSNDLPDLAFVKNFLIREAGTEYVDSDSLEIGTNCARASNSGFILLVYSTTFTLNSKEYTAPSIGVYCSLDGMNAYDLGVKILKTFDEKYIPDMSSIIVKSSTSGSSKKFKITVDDSGTIKATEVT